MRLRLPEHGNASTHHRGQQLFLHSVTWGEGMMRKRGKVLRDTHDGSGLLMIEGRQYPFRLDPMWKSSGPPKPGLPVDVDFGERGQIAAITIVPESQLEEERAEASRKTKSWRLVDRLAAICGMTRIIEPRSNRS